MRDVSIPAVYTLLTLKYTLLVKTIATSLIILFALPGLTLATDKNEKARKAVTAKKDNSAKKKADTGKAAREAAARKKAAQEKAAREAAARKKAAQEKAAREAREAAAGKKAAHEKAAREATAKKEEAYKAAYEK